MIDLLEKVKKFVNQSFDNTLPLPNRSGAELNARACSHPSTLAPLVPARLITDPLMKGRGEVMEHFEKTLSWLKQLNPQADEALQIAAYAHDIERAFRANQKASHKFPNEAELTKHQEQGAKMMYKYLLNNGADEKTAAKVKTLIEKHEISGTDDQNLLKDADSLSYFETSAYHHINAIKTKGFLKEDVKNKFDWMFDRISSAEAKKLSQPLYEKAINSLNLNVI